MRKPNGWQTSELKKRANRWSPPSQALVQPTAFEKICAEYNLTEEAAADDSRVVSWIRKNYVRAFVPEPILDYLGLQLTDREMAIGIYPFNGPAGNHYNGRIPAKPAQT